MQLIYTLTEILFIDTKLIYWMYVHPKTTFNHNLR
jgi:hypothetical protein